MRAGLPKMEPEMLEKWESDGLYYKMVENTKGQPLYVFHDGPPYANAAIHLGTAMNKVLKDMIVRYKNMTGNHVPYIPGWDTHGLPIELRAIKEYGPEITKSPVTLRKHCHDFAMKNVETQKKQFKRLGTLAEYDDPYLTLKPDYEATQIEIFGDMAKKGYIYRDLKSVYWCPQCVTALAEAEIEYEDDSVDSIYVKFNITEDKNGVLKRMGAEDLSKTSVVIWTTTTWTLPANLATSVGPDFEYVIVKVNDEYLLMAKELVESVMEKADIKDYEILGSAQGSELEFVMYKHPFLDRTSPIIVGDHVTLESGTGAVHTAPGHGVEDFDVVMGNYSELGVVVPVDEHGKMTEEAGDFVAGASTDEANKIILKKITETGNLLAVERITHQYPHCWRCHTPILYRATEQWFCSVEDFKEDTLKEIDKVQFIPEWGRVRMSNMVRDRNAWTISRQRAWGVPIPIFQCNDCEEYIINDETIKAVSELFEKEGSDSWFIRSEEEILPKGFKCPHCEGSSFTKESDTMDVWFDSGVSYAADLAKREGQRLPADLYLEGADQYRGWFQSSLLTSVAWTGKAPYKAVCTHGWVVDGEGRKMSKSLGNGIEPEEIVEKFGADILRLWVASSDYHADVRVSDKILKQLSESYRKIRNTIRYMLGNLSDFNPNTDMVEYSELLELDKWAISRMNNLLSKTRKAYDELDFYVVYHNVLNFCTIDMSNFYLDILKDRLYIEKTDGVKRRAAQSTMYNILRSLTLLLTPILSFTAEEVWQYMAHFDDDNTEYAQLNTIPEGEKRESDEFVARWDKFIEIRDIVNKALEDARADKTIGKSLEAKVVIKANSDWFDFLTGEEDLLKTIFIVSDLEIDKADVEEVEAEIEPAIGGKCERCWTISPTVGEDTEHPTLCDRCLSIITGN